MKPAHVFLNTLSEWAAATSSAIHEWVTAAEALADWTIANPAEPFETPYGHQAPFAEELIARAGGLARILPPGLLARPSRLLLLSSRNEREVSLCAQLAHRKRRQRAKILLFASRRQPFADWFVPTGELHSDGLNGIVQIISSQFFVAEFVAALSRRGRHPGVLQAIEIDGGETFNESWQSAKGATRLPFCPSSIPARRLALEYLARVESLLARFQNEEWLDACDHAAETVVQRLSRGARVGIASPTHFVEREIWRPGLPFLPIKSVGEAEDPGKRLASRDLLIWIGHRGVASTRQDFRSWLARAGCPVLTSFAEDGNATEVPFSVAAHLPQPWRGPDAQVALPFAPGRLAPISGLAQALTLRLLELAVFARR